MKGRRLAEYLALGLLAALMAFAVYVRLAPSDLQKWHAAPMAQGDWGSVAVAGLNRATLRLSLDAGAPADLLARLDTVALATPHTLRLAGGVADGRITWVTRSALWGFPDYTTAEVRPDGLYIEARSRFGEGDMGVNAARLRDWLSRL